MKSGIAKRIYFCLQRVRREPVALALKDLAALKPLDKEKLLALQADRLISLIKYSAKNVPYYRRTLAPFGREIAAVRNPSELKQLMRRLPVVKKGEVVGNENDFTSDHVEKIHTTMNRTSGSTGTPLVFPCDNISWAYRHALHIRGARWFGIDAGEPYAYFFGLHWNKRTRIQLKLRDWVLNRVRVSAYDLHEDSFPDYYREVSHFGVSHFLGYPAVIVDFCLMAKEREISLRELELKAILCAGEPLLPSQREIIEGETGAPCVNTYGSVEGGLAAFECPKGSFHIMSEAVWLQPGPNGALVTDLFLRAFPLINYEIGDEVVFDDPDSVCSCGLPHPMIKKVMGRTGEPILLPNGRVINSHLPGYIFKPLADLGAVRKFRFVERGNGELDLLLVVTSAFRDHHITLIENEVAEVFGPGNSLNVRIVEEIPFLPNAKHRSYVKET